MKKKIYFILAFACALSFTSCKDMLEENSYGRPTAQELLSDPENVYKEVGQVYADLKWLQDHWNMFVLYTASSDEAVLPVRNPDADWDDGGYWATISTMRWNATATSSDGGQSIASVWRFLQQGAVMCNQVMFDLENNKEMIDPVVYDQAVAELIIVRSYYYYMLYDCFGTIPYARSFTDKVTSKPLATETETWVNLVTDLLDNVGAMPKVNNDTRAQWYGRATQGLGYGLLSRLMLNAESFDVNFADPSVQALGITSYDDALNKCIEYCDSIIYTNVNGTLVADQQYQLEDNYFNNFLLYNESSTENIFVIVNSASNTFDKQESAGREINKNRVALLTLFMEHTTCWDLYEGAWNGLCARESFLVKFAPEDVRGMCNGDPSKGDAGTQINWNDVNQMRGWFVGPIYEPTGTTSYSYTSVEDIDGNRVLIHDKKQLHTYKIGDGIVSDTGYVANSRGWLDGQIYAHMPNVNGCIYEDQYDWNTTGPCYAVITPDIPTDPLGTEGVVTTNQVAGARCMKYEVQHNTAGTTSQYGENDFVLMRYAEILFNKAEAALRVGNNAKFQEVLPALQQIQARAGVSESSQALGGASSATYSLQTLDGLLDERGRELYWEFLRRRDLIRYDRFSQGTWQFKETKSDPKYDWFPIPHQYILNSGGNWSQREGY